MTYREFNAYKRIREFIDFHLGIDTILLGPTLFGHFRRDLEEATGVSLIDGSQTVTLDGVVISRAYYLKNYAMRYTATIEL